MTTAAAASIARVPSVPGRWRPIIRVGLAGGVIAVYLSLVGIVPVFHARPLISGFISLGQAALLLTALGTGYLASRRVEFGVSGAVVAGAVAGAIAGSMLAFLMVVGTAVGLRAVLPHASPALYQVLTFGAGPTAFWIPPVGGAIIGGTAAAFSRVPPRVRRSLSVALLAVLIVGLFSGLLRTPLLAGPLAPVARFLFAPAGLTAIGAPIVFLVAAGAHLAQSRIHARRRLGELPAATRRALLTPGLVIVLSIVLLLPLGLGPFFAQVVALVALYVLMGLGLNITLGLAGLLDLGFVAFFAVGAYTVGLLTSTAEFGIAQWPFWAAVPFAVIIAMLFGAVLGLPILGIRGDYLAIATLGFGEIIRILAGSDLMKPILGGPRGIVNIPKPLSVPPDNFLAGPNQIYYIALACAALIAFIAWRLRDSRIGRAWVAIREDEDVAEALGINLVQTKLLAYMLGAAFAGLGGAVFAALVGSIFASSIQLFVSINVVSLIIVGGMGSIPGVVLGAIFLIGLPELFREFSEYRFLFYGIALIVMMRARPEGIWPSRVVRRELHVPANVAPQGVPVGAAVDPARR